MQREAGRVHARRKFEEFNRPEEDHPSVNVASFVSDTGKPDSPEDAWRRKAANDGQGFLVVECGFATSNEPRALDRGWFQRGNEELLQPGRRQANHRCRERDSNDLAQ